MHRIKKVTVAEQKKGEVMENKKCFDCPKKVICTECKEKLCYMEDERICKLRGYYELPEGAKCERCHKRN